MSHAPSSAAEAIAGSPLIPGQPARAAVGQPGLTALVTTLRRLDRPVFVLRTADGVTLSNDAPDGDAEVLTAVAALDPATLGDPDFLAAHGVRWPYMAGAMANGIAGEDLVIALARAGFLASFGAAGLLPDRISAALDRFEREIPGHPFACNLIHSPSEELLERSAVELYLARGVRCVEASAFMDLTPHIVRYRLAGLFRDQDGNVQSANRVIAKVSRAETATKFLSPAPARIVEALLAEGLITAEQAELSRQVPVADDITVEADSGGHTDRRPMPALLPSMLRLRDSLVAQYGYRTSVRIGAAGGIGTPESTLAAFAMGAAYVVTGSVNQACRESGTSDITRALLAEASVTDCEMAPAADMFEMGVNLQVLRKGTLFPMRARRLYAVYREYAGISAIPADERAKLESQIFRADLDEVWASCQEYFSRRDPAQLERAESDSKRQMALIFRWYLGMSSRWSNVGESDRSLDYQIWCGPAMGAFNDWARGSYLQAPERRHVADVARQLMHGAAYLARVEQLRLAGLRLPSAVRDFRPADLAQTA
ncbi:MAG TPA: PfaD family polyunsaturated fatty acid/polyketide biosynthesis protein [Jatrophihabitans sp.]|jgi:PfaD family protein|uniref:PfaD family polyunsaturated fatty acid/polyketide biosynthesis protein n=1 Tax=Jatrophihabitans sp. TaxID=1932789 RepID=UPI002F1E65FF